MENASKALVIAGAILISILLITLGIIVYNGSRSTIDDSMSSMDETSVTMMNSKIAQYEGAAQSATQAKALINQVRTMQAQGSTIQFGSGSITVASDVTNGGTYDISVDYDSATGLVSKVTIVAHTNTP